MKAHQLMTTPVTRCTPDDELEDVLSRMGEQQVRRLPVATGTGELTSRRSRTRRARSVAG
jgi:CBS domain-containing protein